MDHRQKSTIIAVLAGLLGFVLIVGVILVMSKEHRFGKYKSKADGFDISYPASWTYEENKGGAKAIFFSPKENQLDVFQENVNVVIQDLSANPLTLKKYTEIAIRQMEIVFEENFVLLESGDIKVAGEPGHYIVFIGKGPDTELKYKSVWMLKDVTAYQITYTALTSAYDRYVGKMDRMVSSFRLY